MMNEIPRVTSTCPSAFPQAPADQALDQSSEHRDDDPADDRRKPEIGDVFRTEIPTYAPSMYKSRA